LLHRITEKMPRHAIIFLTEQIPLRKGPWSVSHAPVRLQHLAGLRLREDLVSGQSAYTTSTAPERIELHLRDAAAVAANGTSFATRIRVVPKLARRRKIKGCKGARLAESVSE
jgi:hypothetical protein